MNPISLGLRKPLEMGELEMEHVGSFRVQEQSREERRYADVTMEEEEEIIMRSINEHIGFRSIDSD